jgi:hypothetical protein
MLVEVLMGRVTTYGDSTCISGDCCQVTELKGVLL